MPSTAGLADIVTLSYKIIQYMSDVRDGGKDRSDVHKEVLTIYDIFLGLECDLESHNVDDESSAWSRPIRPLFKPDGVVDQLKSVLEEMTAKIAVPQRRAESIGRKLRWPFEKGDVQRVLGRLRSCRDTISVALDRANLSVGLDTNSDVKHMRHAIETADFERALQWLSPLDFGQLQKAPQRRPLEGTGNWFLDSPQVRGWCTRRTSALWCHGIPGAGKTILATALLQRLKDEYAGENVAVLIAYCSFDDGNTHSAHNLLCSFARQLMEAKGKISDAVKTLFTEKAKEGRPNGEQLNGMLSQELTTFDHTFIIVDGLDEVPDDAQKVKLLQSIESLKPAPQLLVTSRPVAAVSEWFQNAAKGSKYEINGAGDEYDQSLCDCDNCDTSTRRQQRQESWDSYSGTDEKDFEMIETPVIEIEPEGELEQEAEQEAEEPSGTEDSGGESESGSDDEDEDKSHDWKAAASYRCESCARDVCVNCYEQFDVCFGCNKPKSTFKWAWPSTLTVTAALEDLRLYILWRIETSGNLKALLDNPRSKAHDLREKIINRVQDEAHKMFLLAKFHMNALEEQITPRELINALETLPSNVNDIYDNVFSRIGNSKLASRLERLLTVVATSQILLSADALAHAIVVSPGDDDIDQWQLSDIPTLVPLCAGLVELDHLGFVRLAHETIGEYIAKTGLHQSKSGHGILAEICLAYLQFSTFDSGACEGPERQRLIEERRGEYPLFSYAATYWGYHASHAHDQMPSLLKTDSVKDLTLSFLAKPNLVAAAAQFMWIDDMESSTGWDAEYEVHGLHLSAHFHLTEAVSSLLATGADVDVEDCLQTTPLMYAAQAGHADVVAILLHSGADPSRFCVRGRTALHRACENSHAEVVKELVASTRDISVNAIDVGTFNISALVWAVLYDNEEIVRLLLTRKDIDPELQQPGRQKITAMLYAVVRGSLGITELMLKDGRVSIETTDSDRRTALCMAANNGYSDMVALLLKYGANMDARDVYDGPPLLRAADENSLECVRLLIESGADCHFKDFHGRGLLHGCAVNARGTITRYLLKSKLGLDPNIQGDNGETPLHDAVSRHSEAVVRILLEHGARTDIPNSHGQTPLRLARDEDATRLFDLLRTARLKEIEAAEEAASPATRERMKLEQEFGHPSRQDTLAVDYKVPIEVAVRRFDGKELTKYLNDAGADADKAIKNPSSELLEIATRYGRLENVKILLERGADLTRKSTWGFTALHTAVDFGQYEVAEYLLDQKIAIDEKDLLNRSALTFAAVEFFKPAFSFLLLKRGAKFDQEQDSLLPTLTYAIDCNEFEVVKILVEGGVPFQIKDARHQTPYQRAKKAGHEEIAQFLYDEARRDKRRGRENSSPTVSAETPPDTKTKDAVVEEPSSEVKDGGLDLLQPVLETSPQEQSNSSSTVQGEILAKSGSTSDPSKLDVTKREMSLVAVIFLLLALLLYK